MEQIKETSVKWLKKELEQYGSSSHISLDWSTFDEIFEQAKEMEKMQIEAAWKRGDGEHDKVADELSKKYYNETYGGNK